MGQNLKHANTLRRVVKRLGSQRLDVIQVETNHFCYCKDTKQAEQKLRGGSVVSSEMAFPRARMPIDALRICRHSGISA